MKMFSQLYLKKLSSLILYFLKKCRESADEMRDSMIAAYNLSRTINRSLKGYDRKVRPNAGGPPVIVKIEFKVISFGEIKEANMVWQSTWFKTCGNYLKELLKA